ncbi:hypothetical protein INT47_004421, partial [Mucor saturninus]
MTIPSAIQKPKQSRASRRGLTMRVLRASPAAFNCAIALANSIGIVPENNDVNNIPDFSDVDKVSIDHDTMNTLIELETRQQEEEHDRYVKGKISDVDNEGAEFEEFQLADDSSDKGDSKMEDVIEDYPFNQNELDSMQFNYLCINNNMTMQFTSKMKKFIGMLITRNDNFLSRKKKLHVLKECLSMIKTKILNTFVRAHEICSDKGCYLFDPTVDANKIACPECGASRQSKSVVKMVDIGDHVSSMLACDEFRGEVEQYREVIDARTDQDPYTDFFSGSTYQELRSRGLFSGRHDIAIVLCVDGFTSHVSNESMVMIHVIIPSIDPSISLDRLSSQPIIVKRNGVHVATSKVYNLGVIADGVEINQRLLMFGGHTSMLCFK